MVTTGQDDIHYGDTDMAIPVALAPVDKMRDAFEALHKARFGFVFTDKPLVVEALEVETIVPGAPVRETAMARQSGAPAGPRSEEHTSELQSH